jgi:glucuronoarabinoxylan endo-1,4-beta-xylanase
MKRYKNIIGRQLLPLLLLASLIAPIGQAAENLLTNPGFESGNTSGWKTWGCNLRAVQNPVHSGDYSVLAYNRTQSWQGPVHSLVGTMEDGKTYTISAWAKLDNAASARVAVTFMQMDGRGVRYINVGSSIVSDGRWTQVAGEFTLNVVGTLEDIDVYFEGPAPGINFYLDDAELIELVPEIIEPNAAGVVDVNTVYQQLEGFGASGAWYEGWLTAHPLKNEIYDVLFKQLGLDIYRIRNTYGTSSSYITTSVEIIKAAESSLGHPIKVMISSWSPPASLKSNASTVGGTLKKDLSGNYMYDEFAKWWADSLTEYSSRGVDIEYVNMQNEPDFLGEHDTCKFTPTETTQWAGYNLAFETVYQELSSRMTELPKMLAAEACGCNASHAYIDALIEPNHVYGFAHHLYADGDYDKPDSFIPAMENFGALYGGKPLFQTEYSCLCDVRPFSVALDLACHIHNSLVHEGVCTFFYWSLFWEGVGGLVSLDFPWQANPSYTVNPIYYAFKQYSAFTDPNWHRIEASTDSAGLRISAFKSPDANELSIVIINVSDIDINLALSLGDFSPISSEIYRTSETEHTAYIGTLDASQSLMLPAQTITTISLTASSTPENCAEVHAAGVGLASDINSDCYVNYKDLTLITDCWLINDRVEFSECQDADLDMQCDINLIDFAMFAEQWLQCNNPEDPCCTPNW